jgi:hypothetical protein
MWHGVGKSKGNEINCSFLLPVRKAISRKADVVVRVEELELGHSKERRFLNRRGYKGHGALERRRSLVA